mmetsp:Transcript_9923/g.24744  ORF Transcript_9923/g.24744 Transcript_9923/m.24744 type:complete len:235 (-) Transcript_9923:854-1558(-)
MIGCFSIAMAQALANMADTEIPSALTFLYMDSKEVISISVLTWKEGTVKVATMFPLTAFCIPVKGTKPSGNSTAASPDGAFLRSAFLSPVAILTSSTVTRPSCPVPTIVARSILAFLAAARAMGVAAMTPAAGVQTGLAGAAAAGLAPAGAPFAAFSTSAAVILPSGPVPATVLRSRPISSAFFLAKGEATTRAPGPRATGAAAAALGAAAAGAAAAGAAAAAAGGAAPDNEAA